MKKSTLRLCTLVFGIVVSTATGYAGPVSPLPPLGPGSNVAAAGPVSPLPPLGPGSNIHS